MNLIRTTRSYSDVACSQAVYIHAHINWDDIINNNI